MGALCARSSEPDRLILDREAIVSQNRRNNNRGQSAYIDDQPIDGQPTAVVVTKDGRQLGQQALVVDRNFEGGLVKVLMKTGPSTGQIKTYHAHEAREFWALLSALPCSCPEPSA